jgi:predicted dehydrogenase
LTMQTAPVRVGLIGLGKMGQNHLRVLSMLKGVELAFLYDANAEAAARLAKLYGTRTGADLEELMGTAEAVVICTPTTTHGHYLRLATRHVRNIFVEKPLARDLHETEQDVQFIQKHGGLNVQVGFIERFNPAVLQLKRVLDGSERVISIDFTRTNKLSSRITDVDVITDLMIHDIDLALYLNGPVREVSAHGLADQGMIAFASALLRHENGRFSRIQASRITEKKIRRVQATCADMFVDCELVRKELLISRQSEIRQQEGEPYTISAVEQTIEVPPQEALLSELQAFMASCAGGASTGPVAEDGLRAAAICDQIQRAVLK